MPVNIGSLQAQDVLVGTQRASAVYVGTTKVWPTARITHWTSPDPLNALGCGPGYSVTVYGEGLTTAQVYFGGIAAVMTGADPAGTWVSCTIPDNAGSYQGHDTPITATVGGVPVDGVLSFVTYEWFGGRIYTASNLVIPGTAPGTTAWRLVTTVSLRGCRPGSFVKCSFNMEADALQWLNFQRGVRIVFPRTGWNWQKTWSGSVGSFEDTITSSVFDQHTNEQVRIEAYCDDTTPKSNTFEYIWFDQQTSATTEDPEASQGGLTGTEAPEQHEGD